MGKRGFTLTQLLVAIVIAAMLINLGIYWYLNYNEKLKVERDLQKVYFFVKKLQTEAKIRECTFTVSVNNNTITATVDEGNCTSQTLTLETANFTATGDLKVNGLGIFTSPASIELDSSLSSKYNLVFDCIKASRFRVCEGKVENGTCVCKY